MLTAVADDIDGRTDITRRQLLVGSAALLVVGLAGCSDDDGAGGTTTTGGGTTTTRPPPALSGDPFALGVASGDPLPDSVILWTRLAPDPVATDGLGGMPAEAVEVVWEVASNAAFTDVIRRGVTEAEPAHAHAVHVDADGLEPGTDYHYRFTVGEHTSPVGRTRTLPEGSPARFGLAVVNCQWFETGYYAAYRHLLDEDVDLVLHLGDYIYEYAGAGEGARSTLPTHQLQSLTDYRLRYASYQLDEDLRSAHHRFPFVLTWDDHEVANNHMGDILLPSDPAPDTGQARKAAAYQAWWEHLPVRLAPPDGPELIVYQHVDIGDLARLYVLDQRQYSDVPPCRDVVADDFGDCADRGTERTRLGEEQEAWFADAVDESPATWNLIGNPVVLAGVDGGNDTDGSTYYLDTWDGFPTARHRFIEQLAKADNPVVLTGDYHAGMVLDVHERPFEQDSALVAPEFMSPAISSPLFPEDVSGRTPQLREQLNGHGYLTVLVEPEQLSVAFRMLADVADAASPIETASSWVVAAGSPEARRQEDG
jgi:alkaline phosphatase D